MMLFLATIMLKKGTAIIVFPCVCHKASFPTSLIWRWRLPGMFPPELSAQLVEKDVFLSL